MKDADINHMMNLLRHPPLLNEPMCKHTTFGIGGNAACYVYPNAQTELCELLAYCHENNISVFFAGSGSNLLVSDEGFDGVVISLQKTFKSLDINGDGIIKADSGVMLGNMVKNAIHENIKGLESLIGVPGTLGGALIMNAGAYGSEISNYFDSATTITKTGEVKKYVKGDIEFSYRDSTFPKDEILVNATFACEKGEAENIQIQRGIASQKRKDNQPLKFRSAGSIFKNPDSEFAAGQLIDKAGLKGQRSGNAEISAKHANFIVNLGDALAEDVIKLIRIAQHEVATQFGIKLELEVRLLGFTSAIQQEFAHA
ncbi:MAG: UDP-N-acetylmuramate dehydrogenase [Candidatus Marinimicrobia bacterium]|jgi:UDP-N-acetylmuramate dehydrogenase|nr:UDP-N-acetylmuramate dehydrogenase [Candidatus Neomarinimicrobiota bacterium]|tara:strand:+ start:2424 stop:3365 length:942 start_codon:yes stop_codon:yes gene_type:complete